MIKKTLGISALILGFVPMAVHANKAQPNIVIYMIDDLGWNQISASKATMGTHSGEFQTPHLEKLAKSGLSFTHAYMQPNCAPSRAAVLSGQYPARIHNDVYVVGNLNRNKAPGITKEQAKFKGPGQTQDVAAEAVTIAEALQKNGYATAHIGKYHVGGHDGDEASLPENQGFDINIGGYKQGHQPVCFAKKQQGSWKFPGLARGDLDRFAAPYSEVYASKHGIPASQVGQPKHVCDALADAMEETVSKLHATGKPFYLQLHAYAVHGPVISRPDLKAAAKKHLAPGKQKKAELAGFIAGMDNTLGRLMAAIDDPNGDGDGSDSLSKNTIIIFTSDNGGTHFNNNPLSGVKGMFTEGGIRVPFIASWPGVVPANTVTERMVHGIDLYPTSLELAGNKWQPAQSEHPLDGESFAATLRDPAAGEKRGPIFYLFPGYMDIRAQPCAVVIDEAGGKRYKLLYFYEADAWELYNISDDVGEKNNMIGKKPQLAARLSQEIRTWLSQQHPTWQPKFPLDKKTGKSAGPPPVL
ncbi:MAG: sulfatase [Akkermansiaceae bacterium]